MIVVYPFSTIDQDLALRNAEWMNELGGCRGHECLTIHDKRCVPNLVSSIHLELTKAFDSVQTIVAGAEIDGWPEGANYFFRVVAATLQNRPGCPYFMWMEPDAIPLREGWLDIIWKEYVRCQRRFMGDRVQVEDIPLHMSGVGIYPNPLHEFAGEAYRAHEIAWDMAAKDQIVPKAYFTKLIEHAWKHPQFHELSELKTQIRPEAVLFHSSKDGSLIDLLREQRKNPAAPVLAEPTHTADGSSAKQDGGEARGASPIERRLITATVTRGGGEPHWQGKVWEGKDEGMIYPAESISCDIFIRTYPGDYQWLAYCILSIHKFCTGFRRIVVVSPQAQPETVRGVEWKVMQDETEDGYLAQQITKLYADVTLDYQPDYILHVDSDVIFTRPTTPQDFFTFERRCDPVKDDPFRSGIFSTGKSIWYYTPYSAIETPWQPITEKFMGRKIENEFMRRFPIMVPRWLYPRIREFCHQKHGMIISNYIKIQPPRAFSEFNALGAYAWEFHRGMFHWVNTLQEPMPGPFAKQYHSWSGITPEIKTEIENTLRGTEGSPASEKAAIGPTITMAANSVPPQIKELESGIWVIKDDTHISKWVEQQGRLDHDQNTLPFILPHIKPGDVVIDAGAFIGDHTIAYSKAVGSRGVVHAFEPNPIAYDCLLHNMATCGNVVSYGVGLSDQPGSVPLSANNGNYGGSYAGEHMKIADVPVQTLDGYFDGTRVDFIKLDIEGCEFKALRGGEKLIMRNRPIMAIEINWEALRRQGDKPGDIYAWLEEHGYSQHIIQENCCKISPLYDILCVPKKLSGVAEPAVCVPADGASEVNRCPSTAPPPVTSSTLKQYVQHLADFAAESTTNKSMVMQRLVYAGLRKKSNRKKK